MKGFKLFLRLIGYAAFAFCLFVGLVNFTWLGEEDALAVTAFFTALLMLTVFVVRRLRRRRGAAPREKRPRRPVNKKRLAAVLGICLLVLGAGVWGLCGFPGLGRLFDRSWPADPQEVRDNLPEELDEKRRTVIDYALSLVGQVDYFWGGKSLTLGPDPAWGRMTQVTSPGSESTGTYRPYGMDCSGFVDWVFYNASGGSYVLGMGGGTFTQHANCRDVSWSEAQPGDLVFYPGDSHVGILGARDTRGRWMVINCAAGKYQNVVITSAEGYSAVARPYYYG